MPHLARQSELFAPCVVQYGDSKTRGVQIVCGKHGCGRVGKTPFNNNVQYTTGGWDTIEKQDRLAAHKFSKMGWIVGKTAQKHRCPECVAATKPFAEALKPIVSKPEEEKMPANGTTHIEEPAVEQPPAMSRDDKRVIFAKLNDVYDNAQTGYSHDWTDKRVAEDLGVPRAWVALVRDENFGPDHNAEFVEQLAYARAVVSDVQQLRDDLIALDEKHNREIKALIERVKPMVTVMEKTERTIAGIEKAMR